MADYTQEINSAYDDIKEAGAVITFRRPEEQGTFNPITEKWDNQSSGTYASLTATISSSLATLSIKSASATFATSGILEIGSEKIKYDSVSSNVFSTLTRGFDGTTAASHSTNDVVSMTYQVFSTYGVFTDFNKNYEGNEIIKQGDKNILVPAKDLGITPENEDILNDGTYDWSIVNVDTIAPSGTPIIYKIQGRK